MDNSGLIHTLHFMHICHMYKIFIHYDAQIYHTCASCMHCVCTVRMYILIITSKYLQLYVDIYKHQYMLFHFFLSIYKYNAFEKTLLAFVLLIDFSLQLINGGHLNYGLFPGFH